MKLLNVARILRYPSRLFSVGQRHDADFGGTDFKPLPVSLGKPDVDIDSLIARYKSLPHSCDSEAEQFHIIAQLEEARPESDEAWSRLTDFFRAIRKTAAVQIVTERYLATDLAGSAPLIFLLEILTKSGSDARLKSLQRRVTAETLSLADVIKVCSIMQNSRDIPAALSLYENNKDIYCDQIGFLSAFIVVLVKAKRLSDTTDLFNKLCSICPNTLAGQTTVIEAAAQVGSLPFLRKALSTLAVLRLMDTDVHRFSRIVKSCIHVNARAEAEEFTLKTGYGTVSRSSNLKSLYDLFLEVGLVSSAHKVCEHAVTLWPEDECWNRSLAKVSLLQK